LCDRIILCKEHYLKKEGFIEINPGDPMDDFNKIKNGMCPACGCGLAFQEGCHRCISCGWAGCDG